MRIGPKVPTTRAIKGTGKAKSLSIKRMSPGTYHMSGSGLRSATTKAIKLFKIRPSG